MTLFQLYVLTILPNIKNVLVAISFIGLFGTLIVQFIYVMEKLSFLPGFRKMILTLIIIALFSALFPTTEQLIFISGGYFATNNLEARKLPDNIVKAMNSYLEKVQKNDH